MAPPTKGNKRTVVYFRPAFALELAAESKERRLPKGELIEEAFSQRVKIIRKTSR